MGFLTKLDKRLAGEPDAFLTFVLLLLSVFGFAMALYGTPTLKAAIIAYWVLP